MNFFEKAGTVEFQNLTRQEYVKKQLEKIVDHFEHRREFGNGYCGMFALGCYLYFTKNDVYVGLNISHEYSDEYSPQHASVEISGYYMDHYTLSDDYSDMSFLEYVDTNEDEVDDYEEWTDYDVETDLEVEQFFADISDFDNDLDALKTVVNELHELLQLNPVSDVEIDELHTMLGVLI